MMPDFGVHVPPAGSPVIPGLLRRGKVRDVHDLGDRLLIVATDRISAFDVIMDQPVPGKGVILTRLTEFWLRTLPDAAPHHMEYVVSAGRVPSGFERFVDALAGRAMVVRKLRILPVECVVRGYLAGGGWKEYRERGSISGVPLPAGLQNGQKLPTPIFTPSTKAEVGHDEPCTFERACEILDGAAGAVAGGENARRVAGGALMTEARDRSLAIYAAAAVHAEARGIILADTKFEFGIADGRLVLADEVLTPDSSRFWPADQHRVGAAQPSYDKQFLREFLETLDWPKRPPPPPLPSAIVRQTLDRYREAYERLTGEPSPA